MAFSLIGVRFPRELAPIISFSAFVGLLLAGVNLSVRTAQTPAKSQNSIPLMRKVKLLIGGILLYLFSLVGISVLMAVVEEFSDKYSWFGASVLIIVGFFGGPIAYLLYFVEERSWLVVNSILFMFMAGCLLYVPANSFIKRMVDNPSDPAADILVAFIFSMTILLQCCWMAVILFSPVKQLTRRLGFVVLGVLTLIGLSEISNRNLHQYLQAPKASQNSSLTIAYTQTYNTKHDF